MEPRADAVPVPTVQQLGILDAPRLLTASMHSRTQAPSLSQYELACRKAAGHAWHRHRYAVFVSDAVAHPPVFVAASESHLLKQVVRDSLMSANSLGLRLAADAGRLVGARTAGRRRAEDCIAGVPGPEEESRRRGRSAAQVPRRRSRRTHPSADRRLAWGNKPSSTHLRPRSAYFLCVLTARRWRSNARCAVHLAQFRKATYRHGLSESAHGTYDSREPEDES
uniref:Uncharacterized protein n=1 Tax=Mycena chlorophos TaxID=658473 RepID=A0ABQ0LF13_MYCCL|nr:predicted protein [Mycena chlorophos]